MSKYVCTICGYVYDDAKEAIPFNQLPADWQCPLCGAGKEMFQEEKSEGNPEPEEDAKPAAKPASADEDLREMGAGELSAICSNLARGCEKQYRSEEAALFTELAAYYSSKTEAPADSGPAGISGRINDDLGSAYPAANAAADSAADRGAKRVLTWSEKVTRMMQSLMTRYEKEGSGMLEGTKIWVCDICGFIYIGEVPPAICPVCKVPSLKILEVK